LAGTSVSVSRKELLVWAENSLAFYGLDLLRISTVFLAQAYSSEINGIFDTFDLTTPIKYLEGAELKVNTTKADQFKHQPLTGLYKIHFNSARFLPKNLSNFIRSKAGDEHFNKIWLQAVANSNSEYLDESFIKYLTHHITVDPIEIKSQNKTMTGEWVVFHKHNNQNYYLTIASHKESNEEIHKKVSLACEMDGFPFIV
jgi:hypothetical protein